MGQGLLHIYYGDGKGKTTSAIGLGVRASGHNMRVLLVQFLKNSNTGEINTLKEISNFEIYIAECKKFFFQMNKQESEDYKVLCNDIFTVAKNRCMSGEVDLVIFDEICDALNMNILSPDNVLDFLKRRPENLEVVFTGRKPEKQFLEMADYVTECCMIKHPFSKGVAARKGIEM